MITVRTAKQDDVAFWLQLRTAFWPDDTESEHRKEIDRFFAGEFPRGAWTVLLAKDAKGGVLGFAELSIRPYAEGCRSNRVAYLEGWFVLPEARERGVGKALIEAAENWGRAQGCSEFGSDADPDNELSRTAHCAVGFTEVGLVRCFRKNL